VVKQTDVELGDGRRLHAYDCGDVGTADRIAVFWQHGTTNIGAPPQPLFSAAARLGIRWGSYDRRGYGGSTARPGRDVASAADDVAAIAEALGIDRFAIMGHSGGGPHALACGARLPGPRPGGGLRVRDRALRCDGPCSCAVAGTESCRAGTASGWRAAFPRRS
jgi:pimeloyl-ACP methyl ester carboxylesterase